MRQFKITSSTGGAALWINITTNADKDELIKRDDDVVFVTLTSPHDPDEASSHLIDFLAKKLGIRRERIATAAGKTMEKQMVIVIGMSPQEIESILFND